MSFWWTPSSVSWFIPCDQGFCHISSFGIYVRDWGVFLTPHIPVSGYEPTTETCTIPMGCSISGFSCYTRHVLSFCGWDYTFGCLIRMGHKVHIPEPGYWVFEGPMISTKLEDVGFRGLLMSCLFELIHKDRNTVDINRGVTDSILKWVDFGEWAEHRTMSNV